MNLRQQWADVIVGTWVELQVQLRTIDRLGIVVMRDSTYREKMHNAIDLGVEAHRTGS